MADVVFDPKNSDIKTLRSQAMRAYVLEDYNTAVQAYSRLSELLSAEYGDDQHDSLGDIYLYYGKSLLELARKESEPLGLSALKNVNESDSDEAAEEIIETITEEKEEAAKTEEVVEEKSSAEKSVKEDEEKKEEKAESISQGKNDEDIKPGTSSEEENKEKQSDKAADGKPEAEEELTDLQVGWEVLELAKQIFKKRGDAGKKNLAETLIALGEISMESENFDSAIEDIMQGLEIQRNIFGNDSRAIAETHYKLGMVYSINSQMDEAIEQFYAALEYLLNRINNLRKNEEENADEIREINTLIPELHEKIADMKNFKIEVAQKLSATLAPAEPSATNGSSNNVASSNGSGSSTKQATDISHLVKRKRKSDEEEAAAKDENPSKKVSI